MNNKTRVTKFKEKLLEIPMGPKSKLHLNLVMRVVNKVNFSMYTSSRQNSYVFYDQIQRTITQNYQLNIEDDDKQTQRKFHNFSRST